MSAQQRSLFARVARSCTALLSVTSVGALAPDAPHDGHESASSTSAIAAATRGAASSSSDSSSSSSSDTSSRAATTATTVSSSELADAETSGWTLLNPYIKVETCTHLNHPPERVMRYMGDCRNYHKWWPATYDFTVKQCNDDVVDSIIHFRSMFGEYDTRVASVTPERLTLRYTGILAGQHTWSVQPRADGTCSLCYRSNLKPTTYQTQLLCSVSSKSYLASYFEPLVASLQAELDARFPTSDQ